MTYIKQVMHDLKCAKAHVKKHGRTVCSESNNKLYYIRKYFSSGHVPDMSAEKFIDLFDFLNRKPCIYLSVMAVRAMCNHHVASHLTSHLCVLWKDEANDLWKDEVDEE